MPDGFSTSCRLFFLISAFGLLQETGAPAVPALLPARFEYHRVEMGTLFRIVLYAERERDAFQSAEAAFDRIHQLNRIMSDYQDDSELMQMCRTAHETPQVVSPDLFYVLDRGLDFSRRTAGAFDITVGPLVRLWRGARKAGTLPDPSQLVEARRKVGYGLVELNPMIRSVRLAVEGMQLDLGAIAKGYAADQALEVLRQRGILRALVDAGGDVRLGDAPPGSMGWRVKIAGSESDSKSTMQQLSLHNCAVATSGDRYQFTEIEGVRYSHILDPRTGLGVTDGSVVTVIAADALTADALATALSLLNIDSGFKLVQQFRGAEARILRPVQGRERVFRTRHFPP